MPAGVAPGSQFQVSLPGHVAAAAPLSQTMSMAVPLGTMPGSILQFNAPDGRVMNVPVPAGVQPGQSFQFEVTSAQAAQAQPAAMVVAKDSVPLSIHRGA